MNPTLDVLNTAASGDSVTERDMNKGRRGKGVKGILDNVHTSVCMSVEQLDQLLSFKIPLMLEDCRTSFRSNVLKKDFSDPSISTTMLPKKVEGKLPIRLLIIDSITALLRGTETAYSSTAKGLTERSRHLCAISDRLKALAVEYEIAIVIVNQVSDVFNRPSIPTPLSAGAGQMSTPPSSSSFAPSQGFGYGYGCSEDLPPMGYAMQSRYFSGQSRGLAKEASLGIVWANCLNTRLMLSRTGRRRRIGVGELTPGGKGKGSKRRRVGNESEMAEERGDPDGDEEEGLRLGMVVEEDKASLIRRLHVVFSPFAPAATIDYVVTPSGLHSIPDTCKLLEVENKARRKRDMEKFEKEQLDENPIAEDEGHAAGMVEEFGDEVFDDLGELPAEFWEGKWEELDSEKDGAVEADEAIVDLKSAEY